MPAERSDSFLPNKRGSNGDSAERLLERAASFGTRPKYLAQVPTWSRREQKEQTVQPSSRSYFGKVYLLAVAATVMTAFALVAAARAADEPDLIFKRSTVFKWVTPNDKLATYGLDDPEVEGVACHFTAPERGGLKGWIGVAEEVSDISLSCSQVGPIRFKTKFEQGEDVFRRRRSLFFKKMQIVRGCDVKRNVLVYMVYSDRIIEGSPKNSTSSVPIMPWGSDAVAKCGDWIEK
jgi:CreA protein